jgi:DNA-binding PadR family transcriptional regulator
MRLVLTLFLRNPDAEWYGRELYLELGLKGGTVYPILGKLEEEGWVDVRAEVIDESAERRRARKYYRLSVHGRRAATELLQERAPTGLLDNLIPRVPTLGGML